LVIVYHLNCPLGNNAQKVIMPIGKQFYKVVTMDP
jgi:hypothetical protein